MTATTAFLVVFAGIFIVLLPHLSVRRAEAGLWSHLTTLTFAGLILALSGVQIRLFDRVWLDAPLTVGWVAVVGSAIGGTAEPKGLMEGLAAMAGTGFLFLALAHGQTSAATLAVIVTAASLSLIVVRPLARPPVGRAARWGLGFALAALGIVLSFPGRSPESTRLIPAVVLGLPLANLALALYKRLGEALLGWQDGAASFANMLEEQGLSVRQSVAALWGGGAALGAVAMAMSFADSFLANLFAVLAAALGVMALHFRTVVRIGRWPFLIYTYAAGVLLLFIASLRYRFLDFIFVGALSGNLGWDFFQIPRAFERLIHGVGPLHLAPEIYANQYGPYGTDPSALHPTLLSTVGGLLYLLPPWTAYAVFVGFILLALFFLNGLFGELARTSLSRALIFLCLFAMWPLYLTLWMGQAHIFPVLSYGLVAYALLLSAQNWTQHAGRLLVAGLLIGLFSKPLVVALLPVLLAARPMRRPTVVALSLYGLISLPWAIVPPLNPGQIPLASLVNGSSSLREYLDSGNLYHWTYILFERAAAIPTNDREVYSLTAILNVLLPENVLLWLTRGLTGLVLLYQIWLVAGARSGLGRAWLLILSVTLSISFYFVTFTRIYEYQYTTLAVVPIVFLLLYRQTRDRQLRQVLACGLIAYLPYLLPSIFPLIVPHATREVYWDYSHETLAQMTIYRVYRVLPAALMFLFNLLALRRVRLLETESADVAARLFEPAPTAP